MANRLFIAEYRANKCGLENGFVKFESAARLNSKQNMRDARCAMLDKIGKAGFNSVIVNIEKADE